MAASPSTSQVLRLMVGVQVTEEQLESITDRTVQEADEDGDGAVSFMEFSKVRMPLGVPRTDGHGKGSPKEEDRKRGVPRGPWGWERKLEEQRAGVQVRSTTTHLHQSLEKMDIEQKMSIRILK